MPRVPTAGETINGYKIVRELSKGAMAIAFEAKSPKGERVFFKMYKSPTCTVPWYKGFVKYQQELKKRIEASALKNFCYRFIDFFESDYPRKGIGPFFFEVFEFVEHGHDLEGILQKVRAGSIPWETRIILAKVMMAGINALHGAKIVHSDLKPPNIQLFTDSTISAGYRLKLIDMDYSVLADVKAPWHGVQGYVGSPRYFSPEHLAGEVPVPASDVFTAALMLYELLGEAHPYPADETQFKDAVLAHRAGPIKLAGPMANEKAFVEALHQCLNPKARKRPSAQEIWTILTSGTTSSGKTATAAPKPVPPPPSKSKASEAKPAPPPPKPRPVPDKPKPVPAPAPAKAGRLCLSMGGQELVFNIPTKIGSRMARVFGEDAKFWDNNCQFTVDNSSGGWQIVPNASAANETLVNGKAIKGPTALKRGDVVGVGREAKGVVKTPLVVDI